MYSFCKGGPGVLPRKILENLECRKSHLPHFLGLFFINQFSLFFFCYSLKFSGYSLYFKPSLYSNQYFFFACYSLISIKNGHYSLINKPHSDPQRWGLDRNVLRPTPGDPWGVEQHHWNTGAKENQQLNPGGPSNRQKSSGPNQIK